MIKKLPNIQCALPVGSIDCYIHSVNQVPILSLDEEQNLARLLEDKVEKDNSDIIAQFKRGELNQAIH